MSDNFIIKSLSGERYTPYTLAKKLDAKVLLESASFHRGRERYSLLLLEKAFSLFERADGIFLEQEGKISKITNRVTDILDIVLYFANQHRELQEEFPVPAGGIGYLSYEYAAKFDTIHLNTAKPDPLKIPQACFLVGHVYLIFDHYTDTIILLGLNYKESRIDLNKALARVEETLNDLNFNFMTQDTENYTVEAVVNPHDQADYEAGVLRVKEQIIKGNLLQGVLSRRLCLKTRMSALYAYKNLRSFNPSPYMFYLDLGQFQLFGSSPEVHVKVQGNKALVRPIAGTRRRGKDKAEDEELAADLLSDEKEKAEHLMLVDLARNDLGRICKPGSVCVTASMVIEKYSHVIHVVSQVEGELLESKKGIDAIRATFPAGTVSGAPKIRAIEVIDGLEQEQRTFYAGIVGYVEPGGSLDTCITIRSAYKRDDLLVLQAGAGIVYDSVPENEFKETNAKLGALVKAIGLTI